MTFFNNIAEIQWIDGKPEQDVAEAVLIDAWNFLAIDERILAGDIQTIKDEEEIERQILGLDEEE